MTAFIIIGIIVVLVILLEAVSFLGEKGRHRAMLDELGPWLSTIEKMDAQQLELEYRRIRKLWLAAKEDSEKLELQLDLLCAETMHRAKLQFGKHFGHCPKKPGLFRWLRKMFSRDLPEDDI